MRHKVFVLMHHKEFSRGSNTGKLAVRTGQPLSDENAAAAGDAEAASLSQREKEVLGYITKGFTADEIARLMGLSRYTVQTFVRRIYSKLKVNSKAEAIYEARSQGLFLS